MNGLKIGRLPRCRWCGREPEFEGESEAHTKCCTYCEALQDPVLALRNGHTGVMVQFYVNPDAGLFVEFTKKTGATDRYVLSPEKLRAIGVLQSFGEPLNGRK